jgi:tetratricopeptide (TPR) repeat protein
VDDVAVQLAWHFSEAGVSDKAVRYLRRAGELAVARYANAEAEKHFSRALELAPPQDLNARFELLLAREAVYSWQGNREAQERDLAALAALAEAQGNPRVWAEAFLRQAEYARVKRDYAVALDRAQAAVAQAEKAGEQALEAQGYALWGRVLLNKGEYAEAREWLELGLDMARASEMRVLEAHIAYDLALSDYYEYRYEEARQGFEIAQQLYRGTVNRMGEINTLLMLGVLQAAQGNVVDALPYLEQALEQAHATGWRYGEAFALGYLGNAYLDLGAYAEAQPYHLQALEVCQGLGDREGEATSLDTLGLISCHLGQSQRSLEYFAQALAIQRAVGNRRGEGYTLTHQGHALADLGQVEQAHEAFQQALSIRRDLNPDSGAAVDDLAGLARVALAQDDLSQARTWADQALDWMEQSGTEQVEYPIQAYAICYQVWEATAVEQPTDQARARAALEAGFQLLQQRAARIQDAAMRHAFLNNVPFNRELLASWQATHPGRPPL